MNSLADGTFPDRSESNSNANANADSGRGGSPPRPLAEASPGSADGPGNSGARRWPRRRVAILGGGLSGLVAAHRIHKSLQAQGRSDVEIVVLESKDRVGGAIWTERRDGFTLEGGADSFITNKPHALELCRELGLGDELIATDNRYRRSFVVRKGRLAAVPEGFVLLSPSRLRPLLTSPILSWRGKLRMLMDLVLPARDAEDAEDESLASFVKRRFGREALDRLVQPLVAGIYTADPNELSLRATMPQFPKMEREHRSLILAAWRQARSERRSAESESSGARYGLFLSLRDGMATLPRTLAASLPPGTIRLNAPARRIVRNEGAGSVSGSGSGSGAGSGSAPWRVEMLDGPAIEADVAILATEAHAAARLADGFDQDLAQALRSIPYASSAIVTLGYRRDQIKHPLNGFGAVAPEIEHRRLLAVSFTSVKFPIRAPEGCVLTRSFFGGAMHPEMFGRDDAELERAAREELGELIGARGMPLVVEVSRHGRAMPQYTLGHLDRVAAIRSRAERHEGLILAGNAYEGVGVPDCVRVGEAAARAALERLAREPRIAAA